MEIGVLLLGILSVSESDTVTIKKAAPARPQRSTSVMAIFILVLFIFSLLAPPRSSAALPAHPSYDGAAQYCGLNTGEVAAPERREVYDGGRIIDISHRFHEGMPSFGSGEGVGQFLWLQESMKNGSKWNGSVVKLHVHTGTHVDAPGHYFRHYFEAGYDVDTLDLSVLNGKANKFSLSVSSIRLLFGYLMATSSVCH